MNPSTNTRYDSSEALKSLKPIRYLADGAISRIKQSIATDDLKQRTWFKDLVWFRVGDLFTDLEYQRLLNLSLISGAKRFDPDLYRPIYAFQRPDGVVTVSDGQHTSVIATVYTKLGPDFEIPVQLIVHPLHYTLEQCISAESDKFGALNTNRRNVNSLDKFRASLASKDDDALKIRANMVRFGVHIQGIGDDNGHSVNGFTKLCDAMNEFSDKPQHLHSAIQKYAEFQADPRAKKWKSEHDMKAALIFGLAMVYHLLDKLSTSNKGDKYDSLSEYLNKWMFKTDPKEIERNTAGNLQKVLIARRIIAKANNLIESGVIKNRKGLDTVQIGEAKLACVGLQDPSRSKLDDDEKSNDV